MGIPFSDAGIISQIIGERMILAEVVSFQDLANALGRNLIINSRSVVIAIYALCGFAYVVSMAIFVGGIAALAPSKKSSLARLGGRALFAATLACFMTACVAGVFYVNQAVILTPNAKQFIKNTGKNDLKFLCIVDPAWKPEYEEVSKK